MDLPTGGPLWGAPEVDQESAIISGLTQHNGAQSWAGIAPSFPLTGKRFFLSAISSLLPNFFGARLSLFHGAGSI